MGTMGRALAGPGRWGGGGPETGRRGGGGDRQAGGGGRRPAGGGGLPLDRGSGRQQLALHAAGYTGSTQLATSTPCTAVIQSKPNPPLVAGLPSHCNRLVPRAPVLQLSVMVSQLSS